MTSADPRTQPVVVKLSCEATRSTDTMSIPPDEWNTMTPAQRAGRLHDAALQLVQDSGGYGYHVVDRTAEDQVGHTPSVERARVVVEKWDNGRFAGDVAAMLAELRDVLGMNPIADSPAAQSGDQALDLYIELIVDAVRALHQPDGIERPRLESHVTEALRRRGWAFDKTLFAQAIIKSVSHDHLDYLGGEDRGDILYRATTDPQMGDR